MSILLQAGAAWWLLQRQGLQPGGHETSHHRPLPGRVLEPASLWSTVSGIGIGPPTSSTSPHSSSQPCQWRCRLKHKKRWLFCNCSYKQQTIFTMVQSVRIHITTKLKYTSYISKWQKVKCLLILIGCGKTGFSYVVARKKIYNSVYIIIFRKIECTLHWLSNRTPRSIFQIYTGKNVKCT